MHNAVGEVAFTVYPDDKKRFLAKGGKLGARARVRAPSPRACFWLKPGYYAIAQYHDENSDHNFNRTLFMPKEGFGFSNDAPTSIGLPSFDAARTALPASGDRRADEDAVSPMIRNPLADSGTEIFLTQICSGYCAVTGILYRGRCCFELSCLWRASLSPPAPPAWLPEACSIRRHPSGTA